VKKILLAIFILSGLCSIAQEEGISIQGKIVDTKGDPVSDVYIINLVTHEKDITLENGVFTITISPTDSLVLSHISYFRKIITATSLLLNPLVTLEGESLKIEEITVSPDQVPDEERVRENLQQDKWEINPLSGDGFTESERAKMFISEHNSVMRSEATSLTFFRFSIGDILEKWKKKRKVRKNSR